MNNSVHIGLDVILNWYCMYSTKLIKRQGKNNIKFLIKFKKLIAVPAFRDPIFMPFNNFEKSLFVSR